jgi:hypothetical protein
MSGSTFQQIRGEAEEGVETNAQRGLLVQINTGNVEGAVCRCQGSGRDRLWRIGLLERIHRDCTWDEKTVIAGQSLPVMDGAERKLFQRIKDWRRRGWKEYNGIEKS